MFSFISKGLFILKRYYILIYLQEKKICSFFSPPRVPGVIIMTRAPIATYGLKSIFLRLDVLYYSQTSSDISLK